VPFYIYASSICVRHSIRTHVLGPRLEKKVGLPEHMSACALAGVCFILDFDGRRMTHLMHAYRSRHPPYIVLLNCSILPDLYISCVDLECLGLEIHHNRLTHFPLALWRLRISP
jgi:hypothetical protein